ncbi:DUF4177 domain-containing protein [Anaerobacillus isosaccharinicus]|uniref:DUF4177 domain-containing protein n=1 Tax=Anaerobacillus isosaccharinicus TaxID=1532552 RepID=A0A1S2L8W2_9BACI|nr:DUF4177 domain-containing protein [Anaerobacillus isosaccharinicus]MBA5588631.1 DUF4177 domain-containing protein [Anaerobacillus isosaccharinicus]QOY37960.1 DUF4177 domain-containing protein [Anaerobacillus isosaccharinicus]
MEMVKLKKFEYRTVEIKNDIWFGTSYNNADETLNKLGEKGWAVVASFQKGDDIYYTLMREM